jgi:hypothetical protein
MGIGWEIFTDPRAVCIATWAIKRNCNGAGPLVTEALRHENPDSESLADTLGFSVSLTGAGAKTDVDSLDRYMRALHQACRELAPRWAHKLLHELADFYAACLRDGKPAEGAVEYLNKLAAFLAGEID